MSIQKSLARGVAATTVAGLLVAVPAATRLARPDEAFLEQETQEFHVLLDSLLAECSAPIPTLDAVRTVLSARRDAVSRLEAKLSLTSLDGIETLDRLDDLVVRSIHTMVDSAGVDSSQTNEEQAFLFAEAMAGVPSLGNSPVGFMVISFINLAIAAADSVQTQAHIGENPAALLGLIAIRHATDLYVSLDQDLITQDQRSNFRQSSILMRLRCPKDDGSYKTVDERARLLSDRSLARISILVCSVCGDTLEVTYPLLLPSALQQRADEQQLDRQPRAPGPPGGVEP